MAFNDRKTYRRFVFPKREMTSRERGTRIMLAAIRDGIILGAILYLIIHVL